jgi:hypothetical protein
LKTTGARRRSSTTSHRFGNQAHLRSEVMHRTVSIVAMLAAAVFVGCGKASNPPAPAPKFQPASDPTAGGAQSTDRAEHARGAEAASEPSLTASEQPTSSSAVADEMPAEEKAEMSDDAVAGDSSAIPPESDVASREEPPATAAKSKGSSGKLLKGLGDSLGRALSKSAGALSGSSSTARPAPKPEDDPFPNGEPTDKPKD